MTVMTAGKKPVVNILELYTVQSPGRDCQCYMISRATQVEGICNLGVYLQPRPSQVVHRVRPGPWSDLIPSMLQEGSLSSIRNDDSGTI